VPVRHRNNIERASALNIEYIEKLFYTAFETTEPCENNLTVELLRHKTPLHCGGMADPFQSREFKERITYRLIELSNKYDYPICFSTKANNLPNDYFEILNPKLHAFQISICGFDEDFINKYETNTGSAESRVEFLRLLRSKGFWCSIRIQPIIDVVQALKLVDFAKDSPSYITVEHLKISLQNEAMVNLFKEQLASGKYVEGTSNFVYRELSVADKVSNIKQIIELANKYNVLVGVGDNDLHYMSQSRCCCGIDTIGESFDNYLKYNLTYFTTGDYTLNEWYPKSNCSECFLLKSKAKIGLDGNQKYFKSCTDEYILNNPAYLGSAGEYLNKKLFGATHKKLF
jgi:DNA repair photolyase